MNKPQTLAWLLAGLSWLLVLTAQAAQSVKPTVAVVFADAQATIPVNLTYTVSTPDTEHAAGLSLRVHYNSKVLDLVSQSPYTSQLQPIGAIIDDTQNLDSDPNTDKYWVVAWVDINAAWPGTGKTPLNLLASQFQVKAGFSGSSTLRVSAAATAKNTAFQTSPLIICAKPSVAISATDALANEKDANTASFRLSLGSALPTECGNLIVNYQVSGTATAGSDYSALSGSAVIPAGSQFVDLVVSPLTDSELEADESVSLSLAAHSAYQLGSANQATITIQDATTNVLPTVMLTSAKLQVLEGTDSSVNLTVARQNGDLTKSLTVYLSTSSSATAGSDYELLPSTVLIAAGQSRATLRLNLLNDTTQEQNESVKVSLTASSTYQLADLATVDLVILDDESRTNTDLALDQVKPQAVPTLNAYLLCLLSAGLGLLAFRKHSLRQRLL